MPSICSKSLLAIAVLSAGCATVIPVLTPQQVERAQKQNAGATAESLEAGRQTYRTHCGSCHNLYSPGRYAPELWPQLVEKMSERAGLSKPETENVTRYLVTAAGG